jgi:hypothetical protein
MARPRFSIERGAARPITLTDFSNIAAADAFGRLRVASPVTLFDSKAISENVALFYDDIEASGGGTGSTYSGNRASYTLGVGANTAGKRIRQTKQRFNYQPGKSQLILLTGVFGDAGAGVTKRVGYFDENNGLGLKIDSTGAAFFIRSNVTGTPVETLIPEADWVISDYYPEHDTWTGEIDLGKSQIFWMDFEWLGVGSVRFGWVLDGKMITYTQKDNANVVASVYMSTPNLPIRYEIENDGTSAVNTFIEVICASVMSEGGLEDTGITRYYSNGGTGVAASTSGTVYALVGIKLKPDHLDSVVKVISSYVICTANPNIEWLIILNPTVAGAFVYAPATGSPLDVATGATANTVTGGTVLAGGYTTNESVGENIGKSLYYLGSTIAGVPDEIVLCVRPLANSATVFGGLTIRDFS